MIQMAARHSLEQSTPWPMSQPMFRWEMSSFLNVESSRSSLDTIAGVRAEGEVGIQRKALDFRTLLKGVTDSHLRVEL